MQNTAGYPGLICLNRQLCLQKRDLISAPDYMVFLMQMNRSETILSRGICIMMRMEMRLRLEQRFVIRRSQTFLEPLPQKVLPGFTIRRWHRILLTEFNLTNDRDQWRCLMYFSIPIKHLRFR